MPRYPLFITNTLIAIPSCAQVASSWCSSAPSRRPRRRSPSRRGSRPWPPSPPAARSPSPQAARVDPPARPGEVEVLGGPHLVLADVARDDRVAAGRLVQRLDHVLGLDLRVLGVLVPERVTLTPGADPRPPFLEPPWIGLERPILGRQPRDDVLRVAHDRDVGRDVLRDLRGIDVDMDELRPRGDSASLPVIRSSNRAPIAQIRSASSIA